MAHYQIDYKVHLPVDKPYRTENRSLHRISTADAPEKLWVRTLVDLTELLGFGHNTNMLIGLLLNLINPWPDDVRAAIAMGIVEGGGMTLVRQGDELEGQLHPKFDSLPVNGEKRTQSGLILPGGN